MTEWCLYFKKGRSSGLFFLLFQLPLIVFGQDCNDLPDLGFSAQTVRSRWFEYDTTGKRLVQEDGQLSGQTLSGAWRCKKFNLDAALSQHSGIRNYDGVTNTGLPAQSTSDIAEKAYQIGFHYDLSRYTQLGASIAHAAIQRQIQSISTAQGSSESFNWTVLEPSFRAHYPLGRGVIAVDLAAGKAIGSRMALNLIGRDPAYPQLGAIRTHRWQLAWSYPMASVWQWRLAIHGNHLSAGKSDDVTLYRSGVPTGSAYQPVFKQSQHAVAVGLVAHF